MLLRRPNLEMDTVAYKVTRAGRPIKLTKKEFSLLEYFMKNVGAVLTRNVILEHVWDMNANPFSNTVDVHVQFLRKKINAGHQRKLIQTVRGSGYKME